LSVSTVPVKDGIGTVHISLTLWQSITGIDRG
jgi:hypothetical protein